MDSRIEMDFYIKEWEAYIVKVRSSCHTFDHYLTFLDWIQDLRDRRLLPMNKYLYNVGYCISKIDGLMPVARILDSNDYSGDTLISLEESFEV